MKRPMTFVCWLWHGGWNPVYDYRHVNRLHRMLLRTMSHPVRLICITDDPTGIECETFPLWESPPVETEPNKPNCYTRLRLFDPEIGRQFGSSVVTSIDLDCVIRSDLSSLFVEPYTFKAVRGYQSYVNGSMWSLKIGEHADVWYDFDPKTTPAMLRATEFKPGVMLSGSDQAWMSLKMPNAPRWTESHGIGQYLEMSQYERRNPHPSLKVIFFCGRDKPWDRMIQMERSPLYDPIQ